VEIGRRRMVGRHGQALEELRPDMDEDLVFSL
jgi:hypothetical protein